MEKRKNSDIKLYNYDVINDEIFKKKELNFIAPWTAIHRREQI